MEYLAISITARSKRVTSGALQAVTNKLDAWTAERNLTFSSNQIVSMIFRKKIEEPIEIIMRNKIIPSKESTQFLGMTLNREEHINKL